MTQTTTTVSALLLAGLLAAAPGKARATESAIFKKTDERELKLFIDKPADWKASDRRPAIVFFFGGGFVAGSPEQFRPQSEFLARRGMVGVRAEYRLMHKSDSGPPVMACADVKSAIRFVRAHASDLGIDPARIAAGGGSAGGHLAAFTALCDGQDDPADDLHVSCRPDALVLFNPVFNNGPGQWDHARFGDRYREFSPAHNVRAGAPPAIVFLGDKDKLVPVSVLTAFESDMKKAGSRCDARVYPGAGHGFFNKEPYLTRTLEEADGFLVSLGWIPAPTVRRDGKLK